VFNDRNIQIYSSRDRIREQLLEYSRDYLELENLDFSKASYLSYIINMLSILTTNLMYYNTSVYREFFLTRAIQKESVLNLATMLGYNPTSDAPPLPAEVPIMMEVPIVFTQPVTQLVFHGLRKDIEDPEPFKFYAGLETVFTTKNSVTATIYSELQTAIVTESLESGGTKIIPSNIRDGKLIFLINTIQIEEIDPVEEFTIPTLKPYEFLTHEIKFGKPGQLHRVRLVTEEKQTTATDANKIRYTWGGPDDPDSPIKGNSLFMIPNNYRGFVYRMTNTNQNSGLKLFFGNGIIGVQPTSGYLAKISYSLTQGESGNVVAGSIKTGDRFAVVDTINNAPVTRYLQYSCINTIPAMGGRDELSIDEIRANAIARVSSNKRLVSNQDYKNAKKIISDLPINNVIHVLKRSDIQCNEISLFTDLIFEKALVPTRNESLSIDTTSAEALDVFTGDVFSIGGEEYVSMFNISIDIDQETAIYKYLLDDITKSLVLGRSDNTESIIQPEGATFTLDKSDSTDPKIEVYFNYYPLKNIYSPYQHDATDIDVLSLIDLTTIRCLVVPSWSGEELYMTSQYSHNDSEPVFKFKYVFSLSDIPEDNVQFFFSTYEVVDETLVTPTDLISKKWVQNPTYGTWEQFGSINKSEATITIHSNLSEFMLSNVDISGTEGNENVVIYNVPVIKKLYYDNVDQDNFELFVYQKIMTFDVANYKMLTDFINLKFSNTTGQLDNMYLNPPTREPVIGINPDTLPIVPVNGDRYAVSEAPDVNPWGYPTNTDGTSDGFIAEYDSTASSGFGGWVYERLIVNDQFNLVVDQDLGNLSGNIIQKYIFNGETFEDPLQEIPIQLHIVIWIDRSKPYTDYAVVETVKTNLVNKLYNIFGYDTGLYMSDVTKVVQEVEGVDHCKVLKPSHDIFFKYDPLNDFSQSQLLTYTPELVYFDRNSILIEVR